MLFAAKDSKLVINIYKTFFNYPLEDRGMHLHI